MMKSVTMVELVERYDALFFDAYGVLLHQAGLLPHAKELLNKLIVHEKPFWIVTNGSSRTVAQTGSDWRALGLPITDEQIISSGLLLNDYFQEAGLVGKKTWVLGPAGSVACVNQAGGQVVPIQDNATVDAIVIANQTGYPFLETVDLVITAVLRGMDRGKPPAVVLTNPDVIYPKTDHGLGITAGAVALLLDEAVRVRFGVHTPSPVTRLGKPFPALFAKAVSLAGTRNVVMIGDQMGTDIAGAKGFGIDAALVTGGLASAAIRGDVLPDWILTSLAWE